jgi:hypothetical protein
MNIPNNIDDFNSQARSFVAKAKEAGKSNTAIANTIKFMYGLYTDNQKSLAEMPASDWELKNVYDEAGNLKTVWVNTKTQETKPYTGDSSPPMSTEREGTGLGGTTTQQSDVVQPTVPSIQVGPGGVTQNEDQPVNVMSEIDKIDAALKAKGNYYGSVPQQSNASNDINFSGGTIPLQPGRSVLEIMK